MSVHHTPVQETDRDDAGMNLGRIIAVGVASLVLFAASAVVAWFMIRVDTENLREERGIAGDPALLGQPEIGLVDQVMFDSDRRLETWQAAKRLQLTTYGWVDRSKGLIRIPIDRAMDQVVSEAGGSAR